MNLIASIGIADDDSVANEKCVVIANLFHSNKIRSRQYHATTFAFDVFIDFLSAFICHVIGWNAPFLDKLALRLANPRIQNFFGFRLLHGHAG